ncbi:MAG: ATP-binding cassette domain-containing protein [Silvanigrellaceae bacterium]
MITEIIKLEKVGYSYAGQEATFTALEAIDLVVEPGEYVAIVGPSGSGKSTLLNILGLLSRPTGGELSIFGHRLSTLDEAQLAQIRNEKIGFVFQNFLLVSRLTVLENILLPSAFESTHARNEEYSQMMQARALELLDRVGLSGMADRLPMELSGGQKQRVAICRAMLLKPQLLLADEPTGALDSASSVEVLKMLGELHSDGCTVVVITHDKDVASRAQRTVAVMDGRIFSDEKSSAVGSKAHSISETNYSPLPIPAKDKTIPSSPDETGITELRYMFLQSVTLAKRSLATHRVRSILTGLGLFIGILSLIVINGLGEIVENAFNKLFYTSSIRKAYVYYDSDRGGFHGGRGSEWRGLHAQVEFPRLAQMFSSKGTIRPFLRSGTCQVRSDSGVLRTRLSGVSDSNEFGEMDTPLKVGRWPSTMEFANGTAVTILGSDTVDQLFKINDPRRRSQDFPVGERLTVDNCNTLVTLTIVGVLGKRDTTFGNRDANDILYVPLHTLLSRMGPTFFTWFSALPHEGIDTRQLANELTTYLSLQSGGKLSFGSSMPADILDRVRGFLWIVQAIVGFIGGLCLFVGGVGIMNMMLVTVAERTQEIGLLKSLGARNFHIRSIILAESVLLCFWSGCIAVVVGLILNNCFSLAVSLFVPMLKDFRWVVAPLGMILGLVVSVGCGLGFGAVPAARAARLDPAECLRAE